MKSGNTGIFRLHPLLHTIIAIITGFIMTLLKCVKFYLLKVAKDAIQLWSPLTVYTTTTRSCAQLLCSTLYAVRQKDQHKPTGAKAACKIFVQSTLAALLFALSNVIVKWLTDLDPFTIAFFRFIVIFVFTIPSVLVLKFKRNVSLFPKGVRLALVSRSILGSAILVIHFYALKHLPLADTNLIAGRVLVQFRPKSLKSQMLRNRPQMTGVTQFFCF